MVDSKNLATVINVVLVVCSGCNGHGVCNYTNIRGIAETNDDYRYATCECEQYWEGEYNSV